MKIRNFCRYHAPHTIQLGIRVYKDWSYISMTESGSGYYVILHFFFWHYSFMLQTKTTKHEYKDNDENPSTTIQNM